MIWCRLYNEFATDPKVQVMPEAMQRRLIMLFCLQSDGCLEAMDDETLACAMRVSATDLQKTKELFTRKGFLEEGTWIPRNWEKRQRNSDDGNARVKRYRERKQRDSNGVVTLQKLSPVEGCNDAGPRAPARSPALSPSPSVSASVSEGSPEGDEESPPQPATRVVSLEELRVANLAIELGCDLSWGTWSTRQFVMGIPPDVVEAALHEAVNSGKLSQPYVGKIAARLKREGIPKPSVGFSKPKLHDPGPTNQPVSAQNLPDDLGQFTEKANRSRALAKAQGMDV